MQGKKSFVLYTDIIHSVNILTDEEAGVLFKHILLYVNDKHPTLEDRLLQATFEPIKQQLKRDLEKYLKRVVIAQANGSKGGRPAKTKSVSGKPKQPDNDNDNAIDTANVNDNGNVIDMELPYPTIEFTRAWNLFKEYKHKQFGFKYKSSISESTALSKLYNLSGGSEQSALLILEQSVANGWKGLFALKDEAKKKATQPSNDYLINLQKRINGEK